MDLLYGLGIAKTAVPQRTGPDTDGGRPYDTWDLYLNASGRQIISDFTGLPHEYLQRTLIEWTRRPGRVAAAPPRARLWPARKPSVAGCHRCTLARTGDTHPVQQYLPYTALLCARHQVWMLGPHTLGGEPFPVEYADLSRAPEVLAAHRDHLRMLRRWGAEGDRVLGHSLKLTETWRRARLPDEKIWPARARRIAQGRRATLWLTLAREAITYPETIAVARLMLDQNWHYGRPYPSRPDGSHPFYDAVARQLERPWLADPDLYPARFFTHHAQGSSSRRQRETTWWTYRRLSNDHGPIELTSLGYQPPPAPKPRPRSRPAARATPRR